MKKLVASFVAVFSLLLSTAFAGGSWGHQVTSPGSYSDSVTVPSTAHVQQVFQAFNYFNGSYTVYGQVVNDGPLGSYNAVAGPQQFYQGDVGAGTYYVYQVVIGSGYSVTTFTW